VTAAFNVEGAGVNVDTIGFWQAPRASKSLMFVTSKDRSLVEVWRYPFSTAGSERAPLRHRCLRAAAGSATNGVVVDQRSDLLYVASNFSRNVCVFSLPDLAHRRTIRSGATYGLEPNLALLTKRNGSQRLYVSDDSVVHVHNARTGRKLSQFRPARQLETMWADRARQVVYIPDEGGRSGVYAYRPNGTPYEWRGRSKFGNRQIFDADAEGIVGYTCPARRTGRPGAGLIVVSDQIDSASAGNDFEVFNRRTWRHLGTVKLRLPRGAGFVHNTDGIGSVRQSVPRYRGGLFTAVQDDRSVVGVQWRTIMRTISERTGRPFGC
jgi:myo-inositol-hexaphosphate 3-phosphohydrolase